MHIWRSLDDVPSDLGRSVVTIGNFDGVHRGHRAVIARAREEADAKGIRLVAVTFDPHPMAVLRPEHAPSMLTSLEARGELLAAAGVDQVLALPFDRSVADWDPQEFVDRVLVEALQAEVVVVGRQLPLRPPCSRRRRLPARGGRSRSDSPPIGVPLDGGPQVWSSTYIRTCLSMGDVAGAAEALGRPFAVRGVVAEGDKRGRELGFPTANVPIDPAAAAPADGVYAGWLRRLDDRTSYPAAISVGTNPTFDGHRERRVEGYVLDRDDLELYGVEVEISFVDRLRGMLRFDSIEDAGRGDQRTTWRAPARSWRTDMVTQAELHERRALVRRPRPALLRRRHPREGARPADPGPDRARAARWPGVGRSGRGRRSGRSPTRSRSASPPAPASCSVSRRSTRCSRCGPR